MIEERLGAPEIADNTVVMLKEVHFFRRRQNTHQSNEIVHGELAVLHRFDLLHQLFHGRIFELFQADVDF